MVTPSSERVGAVGCYPGDTFIIKKVAVDEATTAATFLIKNYEIDIKPGGARSPVRAMYVVNTVMTGR